MSNREYDNFMYDLKNKYNFNYHQLCFLFNSNIINQIFVQNSSSNFNNIVDDLIRKIVTDFYAYYLYKRELGEEIDDFVLEILEDIDNLSDEDVINYVKYDFKKFETIIEKYYEFHNQDLEFQEQMFANIVNKRKGLELTSLYRDFFMVDFEYNKYTLPHNVILGLELIDSCKNGNDIDENKILNYLKIEFEEIPERNNFLNYIMSNVYANLKLNGCKNEDEQKLIKVVEHLDRRMKCFYEDEDYVVNLVKQYVNLYGDLKWFEFKDIRDYVSFELSTIIYKLDDTYKHPQDVIKNASRVFTIMGEVYDFMINSLNKLTSLGRSDEEINDWIKQLIKGDVIITYTEDDIFKKCDDLFFRNLIKLYLVTSFYEYCNYDIDGLTYEEDLLYNYIDKGINFLEVFELFDDDIDSSIIIDKYIEYYFSSEIDELLCRKKIVEDEKYKNVLKMNPYMFIEYRREFGTLLPFETSKATEYGNSILGCLFDIISLSENLIDEHGIKYADIAQMFKNDFFDIGLDVDKIVGFILANIYENISSNLDLTAEQKEFVKKMEEFEIDIDDIIGNDDIFGELLFYFFNLNGEYFSDEKIKALCKKSDSKKIKVLEHYNPFYGIDKELLK